MTYMCMVTGYLNLIILKSETWGMHQELAAIDRWIWLCWWVQSRNIAYIYLSRGCLQRRWYFHRLWHRTNLNEGWNFYFLLKTVWSRHLQGAKKIPLKAVEFGIKTFELCESSMGYLWNFIVYTGVWSAIISGIDVLFYKAQRLYSDLQGPCAS